LIRGGPVKSQKHNSGDLKELKVNIEKEVVESIEKMSSVSGMSVDEIVVIALKRFRSSHADYEGKAPNLD
jgi:fructose-1,6-bisphosphatase/sedoheptulose 1,7-bisphosphatase-like protein